MPPTPSPALVERRLAEVTASLNEATGGAALCRIDGTGGSAKSLEGRMAVLLDLRRALRRDPSSAARVGAELAGRWRADLAQRTSHGASAAWLEYLAGGIAELDHILTEGGDPTAPSDEEP